MNNVLSNLSYGTKSENQADSIGHGTHANARKDCCGRRHLLFAPNLMTSPSLEGMRVCAACARARASVQQQVRKNLPVSDLQELSDWYYTELGFTIQ